MNGPFYLPQSICQTHFPVKPAFRPFLDSTRCGSYKAALLLPVSALRVSASSSQPIPRLQHQPSRAVFAEFGGLLFLDHAEGLVGEVRAIRVRRVEDVAQLVSRQAVGAGKPGVQFIQRT